MFKKGDKVKHKINHVGKIAVVKDVLSAKTLEVEYNNTIFFWTTDNVEKVDEIDPWVMVQLGSFDDGLLNDFENMLGDYPSVIEPSNKVCICESRDLFNFGCRCSAFQKEMNEKERGIGRGDLDREDKE